MKLPSVTQKEEMVFSLFVRSHKNLTEAGRDFPAPFVNRMLDMFLSILLPSLTAKLSTRSHAELGNLPQEQVQFCCLRAVQDTDEKTTLTVHQRYTGIQVTASKDTAFPPSQRLSRDRSQSYGFYLSMASSESWEPGPGGCHRLVFCPKRQNRTGRTQKKKGKWESLQLFHSMSVSSLHVPFSSPFWEL